MSEDTLILTHCGKQFWSFVPKTSEIGTNLLKIGTKLTWEFKNRTNTSKIGEISLR